MRVEERVDAAVEAAAPQTAASPTGAGATGGPSAPDFRLLGPVQAWTGGRPLPLGDRKQRLVLAILLLEVNQLLPVERLVDLVWPDVPPPSARRTLQAHVSRLRATLARACPQDATLVRHGAGYRLSCDPRLIDAHEFRRLFDLAQRTGDPRERAALLDRALALWQGPALADVTTEELRMRLCHGLHSLRLAALEERAEAYLRLGRHLSLLDELTGLAARHPYRQRITAALMVTLHRSGSTAEALDAYQRTRQRLNDELGISPPPELQRLHLAILRGDPCEAGTDA
ncbi:BTAD domain-containing putative transcriptional regulator [Streptomyces sp. V4-01]|uniref:BTAD domain-containing putative transcriptional regulator n=1 Tax=Actinacidiphila polyblastidii TaxID=3110430 RepID=A0ABU7PIH5_9ACTN|nr:BTAD domain-containing putative transcriptional regulator [Streptomyces sp. V4-01]